MRRRNISTNQVGESRVKQLKRDCKPEDANDRSLPSNSYLISYNDGTKIAHDIVMSSKQADIFDFYYDNYKDTKMIWKQTEGRIQPRLWLEQQEAGKKKRKRR
ncbi:MAG: hypothetical protein CM15mL1_1170 [Libanvirus sp.]|nr:MAG: hypothetical protein CM15mL1_1170 [Libanvirus sp.]